MDPFDIIDVDELEDEQPLFDMSSLILDDEPDENAYDGLAQILGQVQLEVSNDLMLIGVGGDYDDEDAEDILTLSPVETVTQLPMAAYIQPEENKLTKARSESFVNLFSKSNSLTARADDVKRKIRDFIESPICSAIPSTIRFTKSEYKAHGDFYTFINNAIYNLLQARTNNLEPLDYTGLFDKIDDICLQEDIYIPPERMNKIYIAIMKIGTYAEALYIPYSTRSLDAVEVQDFIHIESPTLVTSSGLVCPCGELVQDSELVPLSTLITKRIGRLEYLLVNNPVQCPECRRILAIPEQIVLVVEPIIRDIIEQQEVAIKNFVIYRPPVHLIEQALPSNVAHMFDLRNKDYLDIYSYSGPDKAEYIAMYINMVDFWMSKKRDEIDPVSEFIHVDPGTSASVDFLANPLKNIFHTLEVSEDIQSDILIFTKTLIHYLEKLGCFTLTHRGSAFYWYCEKMKIPRYPFPKDKAIRWMLNNAWALAGLKPLTSLVDRTEIESSLIADYVPVINYIYMLRTLAKSARVNPTSNYGYWLKEPATETSTKFIARLEAKIHPGMLLPKLARSKRLFRDSNYTFSVKSFICLHTMANELMEKVSDKDLDMDAFFDLYLDASSTTIEDFYQIETLDLPKNLLIEPVYRFEEFIDFFEAYGHLIFTSAFGSRMIIERAKVLTAALQQRRLKNTFKAAISPQSNKRFLLKPTSISETEYKNILKDTIYLSDDDLPQELLIQRDNMSQTAFLSFMALKSTIEILNQDRTLIEKYPEVFDVE